MSSPVATAMKAPSLAIRERRYAVESSILDGRGNLVKLQVSALTFLVMAGTCQHEANSFFDTRAGKLDKFIPVAIVGFHQGFVGTDRFIEILLALTILCEDLSPGRSDEDSRVVAESLNRFLNVFRNGQRRQHEICSDVGHTAIKEYDSCPLLGDLVGANF